MTTTMYLYGAVEIDGAAAAAAAAFLGDEATWSHRVRGGEGFWDRFGLVIFGKIEGRATLMLGTDLRSRTNEWGEF